MDKLACIEDVLHRSFQQVPFHNLYCLLGVENRNLSLGGTCTDKVQHFLSELRQFNIKSILHTAKLHEKYFHRVAVVEVEQVRFYADVGSGWPSVQLYPAGRAVKYSAYGVEFNSLPVQQGLQVHHSIEGQEGWRLYIPYDLKDREKERQITSQRYEKDLPFKQGIRFSKVVDERFIFLKDLSVRIYQENYKVKEYKLSSLDDALTYIEDVFVFPLGDMRNKLKEVLKVKYG